MIRTRIYNTIVKAGKSFEDFTEKHKRGFSIFIVLYFFVVGYGTARSPEIVGLDAFLNYFCLVLVYTVIWAWNHEPKTSETPAQDV